MKNFGLCTLVVALIVLPAWMGYRQSINVGMEPPLCRDDDMGWRSDPVSKERERNIFGLVEKGICPCNPKETFCDCLRSGRCSCPVSSCKCVACLVDEDFIRIPDPPVQVK